MPMVYAQPGVLFLGRDASRRPLGLPEMLFLVSAFLAPWDKSVYGEDFGFTLCDAVLVPAVALAIVWGRKWRPLPFGMAVAVGTFLLFALVSTFRAPEPTESVTQILQFVFVFALEIPLILTLVDSERMFRLTLLMMLAGVASEIVISLAFGQVQGAGRTVLVATTHNANRLGYPTAYALPFVLFMTFDLVRRRRYWAAIAIAPLLYLLAWAVTASGSRSAALGAVVGALMFLALRHGGRINLRLAVRLLLVTVVVGSASYWLYRSNLLPSTLSVRIEETVYDRKSSMVDDRIDLAKAGWLSFLDSPLIGVGLDNFRYVGGRYVPGVHQVPHNLWIQLLAQVGLIGTLAFLALLVQWFVSLIRAQRTIRRRWHRELIWATVASFGAVLTVYLFVPLIIQRVYWLIFGLGLALVLLTPEEEPSSTPL